MPIETIMEQRENHAEEQNKPIRSLTLSRWA